MVSTPIRFLLVLLPLFFMFTNGATAETLDEILHRGTLRVGMDPAYMPFEFTNKRGEIIGFDVDVARHMAKAMGVRLELVSTPWDGIIPALITNKFDIIISGMTLTQERNLRVNYAEPYIVVGQTVLIRAAVGEQVSSYADLNDPKYKVVSKLGTTGEIAVKEFLPQAQYVAFEREVDGVMEVVNGNADAFVYDSPYNAVANVRYGGGKLLFLDQPFTYEPLAWAVRKSDYNFVNWLDNFLNQIRKDGTYDRISHTWFMDSEWLNDLK
jgi:polar amino acid transport system substrate-binding protein